jgi:hypothetical protein
MRFLPCCIDKVAMNVQRVNMDAGVNITMKAIVGAAMAALFSG